MAVYSKTGNELTTIYNKSGNAITGAYNKDGTVIYDGLPSNLKVMTYNVGGWYTGVGTSVPAEYDTAFYNLQNGIISDNAPDILCIEEYHDEFTTNGRTALSVLSPYYDYIQTRNGYTNYEGRAICSKYPFVENSYEYHQFENDEYKYFDRIDVDIDGHIVSVIVTHLSTTQNLRPDEADELLEYVSDLESFVICGDFNTTYADSISGDDYVNVYKKFLDAGYNLANCTTELGFNYTYYATSTGYWRCLDNIISSSDIEVKSIVVDQTKVNDPITQDPNWKIDHLPFMANMRI